VDKAGLTVDFRLSRIHNVVAAKAFFRKAIQHEGRSPQTITLDSYAASHRAVREIREDGLLSKRTPLRSSKYLNNLIEQDHRGIKFRTRPMLGFKNFESAAITIAGIELLRHIYKGQFMWTGSNSSARLRRLSGMQYSLRNRSLRNVCNSLRRAICTRAINRRIDLGIRP
jgi:transposase-like protein